MPAIVTSCSGNIEKLVIRSKLSLMSWNMLYFDFPIITLPVRHRYLHRVCGEFLRERGNEGVRFLADVDDLDYPAAVSAQHAAVISRSSARRCGSSSCSLFWMPPCGRSGRAVRRGMCRPRRAPCPSLATRLGYLFRWVLQVGVERDDNVAAHIFKSCHYRHVLSEISVEVDNAHLRRMFVHKS
jgi:hypothetical protein